MFKDTADFQQYVPVTNAFSLEAAMPFLNKAIRNYIVANISQAEYSLLFDEYDNHTITGNRQTAWKLLQEACANFCFLHYLPYIDTQASDGGLVRIETETRKSLYKYQKQELKEETLQAATQVLEQALAFMEENKDDFPAWQASPNYTVIFKYFLQTATQFSENVPIGNSRLLFSSLKPIIVEEEELLLAPILGQTLYDFIKTKLATNSLDANEKKLQAKCNSYLARQIFRNAMPYLNITVKNGLIRFAAKDDDNTKQENPTPNNELDFLLRDLEKKAESRKAELIKYLNANVATFTTFNESAFYVDTTVVDTPQNNKTQTTFWF